MSFFVLLFVVFLLVLSGVMLMDFFSVQMYRLTIRATDETVPSVLMHFMEDVLARGDST